jgi:hypothetical protein
LGVDLTTTDGNTRQNSQAGARQAFAEPPGDQRFFGIGHGYTGGVKNKTLKLRKLGI